MAQAENNAAAPDAAETDEPRKPGARLIVLTLSAAPEATDVPPPAAFEAYRWVREGYGVAILAPDSGGPGLARGLESLGLTAKAAAPEAASVRAALDEAHVALAAAPGDAGNEAAALADALGAERVLDFDRARAEQGASGRLKVALLGCGTVGGGVHAFLRDHESLFEVTKILVRSADPARYPGVPAALLTRDADDADIARADVVLESIGGVDPAARLVAAALARGQNVVTANKEIYARRFADLMAAAREGGTEIRASASVGGGVPVLEAAVRAVAAGRRIVSIEGVVNGTTNFVLDEMEAGRSLDEAVTLAQQAGYAEADPSADIDGWDAAAKLSILARVALGAEASPDEAGRDTLRNVTREDIARANGQGRRLRHVGLAARGEDGAARLSVRLTALDQGDFLAGARGAGNRFRLVFEDGTAQTLSGLGAGRWPTAGAMFADLLDLHRLRAQPAGNA